MQFLFWSQNMWTFNMIVIMLCRFFLKNILNRILCPNQSFQLLFFKGLTCEILVFKLIIVWRLIFRIWSYKIFWFIRWFVKFKEIIFHKRFHLMINKGFWIFQRRVSGCVHNYWSVQWTFIISWLRNSLFYSVNLIGI